MRGSKYVLLVGLFILEWGQIVTLSYFIFKIVKIDIISIKLCILHRISELIF